MASVIPIPDDFEACVQHAVDQNDRAQEFVADVISRGLRNVFLVGCGGSHFGTYPAFDLLDRYATEFESQRITSAELTSRSSARLGHGSLVVTASHSGNTPETVAAAEFAKSRGATVIGISRSGDNGLSRTADLHLDYPDTITITEPKLVHNEQLAVALLQQTGAGEAVAALAESIPSLPGALRQTKLEVADSGERVADVTEHAELTYVIGAGPAYGMAKMMAWCYFEEMQWMNAAALNGGDFFHGPLEMVLEDTPVVTLVAEDATRPLGERVAGFVSRTSSSAALVDTSVLTLPGISEAARPDLSVLALMSAERRVLDHVAARRGHDTSVRRYMYKVAY